MRQESQRGLIQLSLMGWMAVGAAVIILGLTVALRIQTARLDASKAEHKAFVSEVARLGEAAKVKADAENKLNLERKAKADESLRKLRVANESLNKRLRDNAGRGSMSGNSADTRIPENACIPGRTVNEAVSRFTERIEGITGRTAEVAIDGQSAIDELNNAKKWAAAPH